ncbi:phytanoyl-CoA dioxygenase family protein [Cupriavidus sp. 30B13]|uniref:phytanoyl-CoA dioxygenase family protein n=1 Tax=Cupriavidus sp. 30B13 TaxID=3384241 RepID=UPI003B9053D2
MNRLVHCVATFMNEGHIHVPQLIGAAGISSARTVLKRMDDQPYQSGRMAHRMLRPKGEDFMDLAPLLFHSGLIAIADAILGSQCRISMIEFGVTDPEDPEQRGPGDPHAFGYFYLGNMGAHRDGGWIEDDLSIDNPPMLTFKAAIWLDDVALHGGNLLLYPGTHKLSPQDIRKLDLERAPQQAIVARAGDVTFFDRRLLHSRTWNQSRSTRRVVFAEFSVPWIRRKQDWHLTSKHLEGLSEMQTRLIS